MLSVHECVGAVLSVGVQPNRLDEVSAAKSRYSPRKSCAAGGIAGRSAVGLAIDPDSRSFAHRLTVPDFRHPFICDDHNEKVPSSERICIGYGGPDGSTLTDEHVISEAREVERGRQVRQNLIPKEGRAGMHATPRQIVWRSGGEIGVEVGGEVGSGGLPCQPDSRHRRRPWARAFP